MGSREGLVRRRGTTHYVGTRSYEPSLVSEEVDINA